MPKATTLPERLALLRERCGGSRRAVSRLLGLADMSLKRWEQGAPALPSKLLKASKKSGISLAWLANGEGNTEKELAKVHPVSVDDDEIAKVAEAAPTIHEAIEFITKHGSEEDVQMLEDILTAAHSRIVKRKSGKPGTKYR